MNKNLLITFVRNPELGKVKTRLAKSVGDEKALKIYLFLLQHTESIIRDLDCDKVIYYSNRIEENDIWDAGIYQKQVQKGADLGMKMHHAFQKAFDANYEKVIIIGSDLYDLKAEDIATAFDALDLHDVVIGPATDGGYYLLGMKTMNETVFMNKQWSTDAVYEQTMKDVKNYSCKELSCKNDIDTFDDLQETDILKSITIQNN